MIPIIIEIFKLIGFLNPNVHEFDEVDYITSLPFVSLIFLALILLFKRLYSLKKLENLKKDLDNEIELIFSDLKQSKQKFYNYMLEFRELKSIKNTLTPDQYIKKLFELSINILENE